MISKPKVPVSFRVTNIYKTAADVRRCTLVNGLEQEVKAAEKRAQISETAAADLQERMDRMEKLLMDVQGQLEAKPNTEFVASELSALLEETKAAFALAQKRTSSRTQATQTVDENVANATPPDLVDVASSTAKGILIFGGFKRVQKVEHWTPSESSTIHDCLRPGRYYHAAAWIPDHSRVLLAGGWDVHNKKRLQSCQLYDPSSRSLGPIQDLPLLIPALGAATLKSGVLVCGGWDGSRSLNSAFLFKASRWVPLAEMSYPRYAFGCTSDGDSVFVIGGADWENKALLATVERYDVNSNSWLSMPSLPENRDCSATAFHCQRVYLTGGKVEWGNNKPPTNTVLTLDPREGGWKEAPPMTMARKRQCLVSLGQDLYAVGGEGTENPGKVVEVFDVRAEKWRVHERPLELECDDSAAVAL